MSYIDKLQSWTKLGKLLPGRTGVDIRNRYHAILRHYEKNKSIGDVEKDYSSRKGSFDVDANSKESYDDTSCDNTSVNTSSGDDEIESCKMSEKLKTFTPLTSKVELLKKEPSNSEGNEIKSANTNTINSSSSSTVTQESLMFYLHQQFQQSQCHNYSNHHQLPMFHPYNFASSLPSMGTLPFVQSPTNLGMMNTIPSFPMSAVGDGQYMIPFSNNQYTPFGMF